MLHGPVRAYMTPDPLTVPHDAPVSAVRRLLREHAFHHVPVVDGARVVGMLSTVDLARVSLEAWGTDVATTDAHLDAHFSLLELMTPEPEVVDADSEVFDAARILADGWFHALPVVEDDQLVGVLTSTDLLRAMLGSDG